MDKVNGLVVKVVTPTRDALARKYLRLNPVRLLAQIDQALELLWSLADRSDHNEASVTLLSDATTAVR